MCAADLVGVVSVAALKTRRASDCFCLSVLLWGGVGQVKPPGFDTSPSTGLFASPPNSPQHVPSCSTLIAPNAVPLWFCVGVCVCVCVCVFRCSVPKCRQLRQHMRFLREQQQAMDDRRRQAMNEWSRNRQEGGSAS